eukprot:CAMPEP_0119523004 /NCGR_PEP_ID=MMETSP1344-20130328/38140_1 /TAXON_ID=236787 /ORGANISM="Florenciella parvula, Strain CCMP2471" /LENGTH=83 /DNA_ID=CAMNT_0007561105 /DNA_START=68 /DNA_END=319 /DNA_ORIENTATION=+
MTADCMAVVVGMDAYRALCLVVVAINAAIKPPPRKAHAGPRHGRAVPSLSGVGGGLGVACGRVGGVVAGLGEERGVEGGGRGW